MQLDVLTELGIPFKTLDGEYSFRDIDHIYSQSAVAFVAFPEAFGVPIVQLQRHGSMIASPHQSWVKRHAMRCLGHVYDEAGDVGMFTENFLHYPSAEKLKLRLHALRQTFDPGRVRATLSSEQAKFVEGDLDALSAAIAAFSS